MWHFTNAGISFAIHVATSNFAAKTIFTEAAARGANMDMSVNSWFSFALANTYIYMACTRVTYYYSKQPCSQMLACTGVSSAQLSPLEF